LFGSSLAAGDVNGDRRADLLVGVAAEDVGAVRDAGAVTVLRGSAAGLTGAGSPQITQDSPGVPGSARQGAAFGAALAVGNHNGDGYGDLVVGAPGETIGQAASAGTVTVLYGASTGPVTAGSRHFHQNTRGVADRSEAGDRFGSEVRAVPVGAGRLDTLVVGVPDEVLRGAGEEFSGEGAIVLLRAGSGGLTGPGSRLLTAADFGDKPVRQGWFGTRLG
ncbi:MAG TPA: FG-GAP repeat protein, partial [Catenuloplanes sp.]